MTTLTAPSPSRARRRGPAGAGWHRLRFGLGIAAACALVSVMLPRIAGASLADLAHTVAAVPGRWLAGLLVLWLGGLLAHTLTLTAGMPGLGHRRALALSLTGSAVANVLPLGGAAGVALNYRMARRWGFGDAAISGYTIVTNAWDLLAKLVLALIGLLVVRGVVTLPPGLLHSAAVASVLVAGVLAACLLLLVSDAAAERVASAADRLAARLPARLRPAGSCRESVSRLRLQTGQVVAAGWPRLSLGMALYSTLLFGLLWACLTGTHAGLALPAVLAGFAVERLLTVAGITPGAAGVVEVGVTTTLLAFPGSPLGIASGVLLYRALTFALEIPVGAAVLAGWWWLQRRRGH